MDVSPDSSTHGVPEKHVVAHVEESAHEAAARGHAATDKYVS